MRREDVLPGSARPPLLPTRSPTMSENLDLLCSECTPEDAGNGLNRRQFVRLLGGSAAALSLGTTVVRADSPKPTEKKPDATKKDSPAETLVKELFSGLSEDQKKKA